MSIKRFVLAALALTAVVGLGAGVVCWSWAAQPADYPEPPFEPQGDAGPVLFAESEFPDMGTEDQQKEWRKQADTRRKYLTEQGAMARATDKERQAVTSLYERQYVKARELAESILEEGSKSVPAHFVLAGVQTRGERNLPLALHQVRRLRHDLEAAGRGNPADRDSREWYVRALDLEIEILNSMDRRPEQLQAIDCLEKVYRPQPWRRLFPLIKLERLDEAEQLLAQLDKRGGWPLKVLNGRCMICEAAQDRAGCYRTGKDMVSKYDKSAVLWNNFGLGCQEDFRFAEAEQAWVRAAHHKNQDFYNSSYFALSELYLAQARLPEAWGAVRKGQQQRLHRAAHTMEQDQGIATRALARVLLALGHPQAERFAQWAEDDPGRLGSNTLKARDQQFVNGLFRWMALRSKAERAREDQAVSSLQEWLTSTGSGTNLDVNVWALERRLVKILWEDRVLSDVFRPYLPGSPGEAPWLGGMIVEFVPAGAAAEAIRQARAAEAHPAAVPYFDALSAHLALRRGQPHQALNLAEQALEKLPMHAERLLRGRVAAVGAEAARQLGDRERCRQLSAQALRDFPQAFRLLGLTLPVHVEDDGSRPAARLAEHLRRSCRFRNEPDGFPIRVSSSGTTLTVRIERQAGDLHVEVKTEVKGPEDDALAAAFRRFHERLTSPWLDLKDVDVNTAAASTPSG